MFFNRKGLSLLATILLGLVFSFAWYLTKDPSTLELSSRNNQALAYLLRSFDQDYHFTYKYDVAGAKLTTSRESQFRGELESAIVLAQVARTDASLTKKHRQNLEIILKDWYSSSDTTGFLSNGSPSMEQNGQGLRLLSASPFYEEERDKADKLAYPISAWAKKDFTTYWKNASSTPAESLGYGILGIANLYQRTGSDSYRETLELLAKRYRLLLDNSPLRLLVRFSLYEGLKEEEDSRALLISANSFLNLQNKNLLSSDYGFFHNLSGEYYQISEQAILVEGLAHASLVASSLGQSDTSNTLKNASLLGASALMRTQVSSPANLSGGILEEINGGVVSTYSTARFIEALKIIIN